MYVGAYNRYIVLIVQKRMINVIYFFFLFYFIVDFFDQKTEMVHTSFVVAHTLERTKYSQFGTLIDAVTISSSKAL